MAGLHLATEKLQQHQRQDAERSQALLREASVLAPDNARRPMLLKHAERSESARGVENCLKLVRSRPGVAISYAALDQQAMRLTVRNGTVDLSTGTLLPHLDAAERAALRRVLRGRGVEGLLLLPLREPTTLVDLVAWENYPVVAATYGLLAPVFHRVVPNQFSNMLTACGQLAGRGYRRIGLVQDAVQDVTVRHSFSGAVAWQNLLGGTELARRADGRVALRREMRRQPGEQPEHMPPVEHHPAPSPVVGDHRSRM